MIKGQTGISKPFLFAIFAFLGVLARNRRVISRKDAKLSQRPQSRCPACYSSHAGTAFDKGAILPFTVEMQEGESLVCEITFHLNDQERGAAKIRVSKKGSDFAAAEGKGKK